MEFSSSSSISSSLASCVSLDELASSSSLISVITSWSFSGMIKGEGAMDDEEEDLEEEDVEKREKEEEMGSSKKEEGGPSKEMMEDLWGSTGSEPKTTI